MIAAILTGIGVFSFGMYIGFGEGRRKNWLEQEMIIDNQKEYIVSQEKDIWQLKKELREALFDEKDRD